MQVTTVKVSFLREKQPAQYEKSQPAVEFAATLDDGEDYREAARSLMVDATSVVYAGLGYVTPQKVAEALQGWSTPSGGEVSVETTDASDEVPTGDDEPKKRRGRPPGSKNTRPKAGTKAAEEAEEAQKAKAADPSDDIPDDDPPANSAHPNMEDRVNPDDDIPDEDVPSADAQEQQTNGAAESADASNEEEETWTALDLHTFMTENIKTKKLTVVNARKVLAHFKVARASDLNDEQALEGKEMLDAMMAGDGGED